MKNLQRLLMLARPLWSQYLLCDILSAAAVLSAMGLMGSAAWLLSKAALHPFIYEVSTAIAAVRFFGLGRAILRYLERYAAHKTTFRLLAKLRLQYYHQLKYLLPYGLKNLKMGNLLSLLTHSIDHLQDFYLRAVVPLCTSVIILISLTAVLFSFCPYAVPLPLLAFFLTGYVLPRFGNRRKQKYTQTLYLLQLQQKSLLLDITQGAEELLLYGYQSHYEQKLSEIHRKIHRIQTKITAVSALENAASALILSLCHWLLLLALIWGVQEKTMDGIWLAAIVFFVQGGFEAAAPLPAAWRHANEAQGHAAALFSLPPQPAAELKSTNSVPLPAMDLAAKNLCFSYLPGKPVLTDISFDLPAGKRIAVIGESGSGKSTLLALLTGFLSCDAGRLQLGNTEYHQIPADALPRCFSALTQEHHIFATTLERNLRIAQPRATFKQCSKALALAALGNFIPSLSNNRTPCLLSGGESQRLGLARVFLHEAPIYLLDEPFANLDIKTAQTVAKSILEKTAGRSLILITHSCIGLEAMDEILVLAKGRIVERGTFTELIANKAWFYQFFQSCLRA